MSSNFEKIRLQIEIWKFLKSGKQTPCRTFFSINKKQLFKFQIRLYWLNQKVNPKHIIQSIHPNI